MNQMNRRGFLKRTAAATAASYMALSSVDRFLPSVLGANSEIRMAVAGINGRGSGLINQFQESQGVRVVALCDPDQQVLDRRLGEFKKRYNAADSAIEGYADVRKLLERKDVDALVIAAPNHWHSLMTVWACQAGKHVYVEKPVSHCIWEGRKMVEAARKYNRLVQAGTQQRSCPAVQEVARDIQAGKYGKVLWVHCSRLNTDNRASIGKVTEPQPVPEYIDYNLWAGPAPMSPLMRQKLHYDWHWQWNWGNGEMANWGVHYLDDVRHELGWTNVPTKVVSAGNRFVWDDNGETPNMIFSLMDYDGIPLVVDIRNLPDPQRRGGKQGALYLGYRDGNHIQCENASIHVSRGGGGAYDMDGTRIYQYKGDGGAGHAQNFVNALRSGRREDLAAEIEVGHFSTALAHLANASWQVGVQASPDQVRENMKSCDDAVNTLRDILEQLEGNSVDLARQPFVLGPMLTYDRKQERFVGDNAEQANRYLKCAYREPFVLPEQV